MFRRENPSYHVTGSVETGLHGPHGKPQYIGYFLV